jgi:hypothetical protein
MRRFAPYRLGEPLLLRVARINDLTHRHLACASLVKRGGRR